METLVGSRGFYKRTTPQVSPLFSSIFNQEKRGKTKNIKQKRLSVYIVIQSSPLRGTGISTPHLLSSATVSKTSIRPHLNYYFSVSSVPYPFPLSSNNIPARPPQ